MSDDTAGMVWLYDDGQWKQDVDPIIWSPEGDDVRARYAEAGYTELSSAGRPAEPFLVLGTRHEGEQPIAQFTLFVRREPPECLIDIEGTAGISGATRTVYVTRLPDALDLIARWAPIAQASAVLSVIRDLTEPVAGRRRADTLGLVEAIATRAASAL